MRIALVCACLVTALGSAERAETGDAVLFSGAWAWVWWLFAAAWLAIAVHAVFWRPS